MLIHGASRPNQYVFSYNGSGREGKPESNMSRFLSLLMSLIGCDSESSRISALHPPPSLVSYPGPYGLPPKKEPAGRTTSRNPGRQETKQIICRRSVHKMDGGNKQRLVDKREKALGRGREGGEEATDGECAAVTSVDLSI